jgi:micrococcal nuclease
MKTDTIIGLALVSGLLAVTGVRGQTAPRAGQSTSASKPVQQPRSHGTRVVVDPTKIAVDDGDTVMVRWATNDVETVRLLGIDCPETRHVEHDLPYGQPFGDEARAFASGVMAGATRIELRRAATLDPYGRTLGYVFVNDRNYSVMVIEARLAEESVTRYGDNGLPTEAATVLAAAKRQGPLPFESPGLFRERMRAVSAWLKARGEYPIQ